MSLLLFASRNRENLGFEKILDSLLASVQLEVCEFLADPVNGYEIFVPVLNTHENSDVTSKLDIDFINLRFGLGVEHMPDLSHLKTLKSGSGISIGLFDFNFPDKTLDSEIRRIAPTDEILDLEICLDHHAVADVKFMEKFREQNVQFAGSCHTLLYSHFGEEVVDIVRSKIPQLLQIAALVIRADSLGFDKGQEGLRWNHVDRQTYDLLTAISTYSRKDEDFENLINCKYSERQFSLGFEKLFYSDAKLCSYQKK